MGHGRVYIVGAGPGDPSLLTLKAKNLIENADVIIHDRLVAEPILRLIPLKVEKICVGKTPGRQDISQQEINRITARKALEGKTVVRLKGGDPLLFGRGGEEAEALREQGIDFEIVPAVTSAVAAAAYAGIPLTHREYSHSVAIVTGHRAADGGGQVDWRGLATSVETIVILMGIGHMESIMEELRRGGLDLNTPVAIIEQGTLPEQRTLLSNLGSVVKEARRMRVKAPAVIVVGKIAELGKKLAWFRAPICSEEEP